MKMSYNFMLDVGGTCIKAGIFDGSGKLYKNSILSFDARAQAGAEEILENFVRIFRTLADILPASAETIGGVAMAFPGPFEYASGVSRMKNIGKYDALYGIPIEQEIRKRLSASADRSRMAENCRFLFCNDVEAFAMGESRFGRARIWRKVMYLCMGTGAGSAFSENCRIIKSGDRKDVPENGWIYPTPFRESIIDDYLSIRGLEKLTERYFGEKKSGKELYSLCGQGNRAALTAYREFGTWFREAIVPYLDSFEPDGFVLGGQLAKSFAYFGGEFSEACRQREIEICLSADTSRRIMDGLYLALQNLSVISGTDGRKQSDGK